MEIKRYKGMRDFLPELMRKKKYLIEKITEVFESFGFEPLETPAIELWTTLSGKYGTEEKLIYRFQDKKGRDIGLRYDLTIPLARVVLMHNITLPFKRYQIQPVWRADKPQKGRFREFYQCDIDIVGAKSLIADAEIIDVFVNSLIAIGVKNFKVKINSRKIIKGYGEITKQNEIYISRLLDKIDKTKEEAVFSEMKSSNINTDVFEKISETNRESFEQQINFFKKRVHQLNFNSGGS